MKELYKGLVEVGDIIIADTFLGKNSFPITRVTKTLAISKRKDDGYEHRFKRKIQWDMSHPNNSWNTTTYRVCRNE